MSSSSLLVAFQEFLCIVLCTCKKLVLLISFQFRFLCFSCLIAMDRASGTTLNKSGEIVHPALVSDLRWKVFIFFTIEYEVSCGFLLYGLYCVEIGFLYSHFIESFIITLLRDVECCQSFILHLLRQSWFSFPDLLKWHIIFICVYRITLSSVG